MSKTQKALSKEFRVTALAYLTELVESGQVTSQAELIELIKAQGWLITRSGTSYVTVAHPSGGRFRFRYVFGDEESETVVYALIAIGKTQRACYVGSTSDFYNRMCQHAKLEGKKRFTYQHTSTEFFHWAASDGAEVQALELERLAGRAMLIPREAAWTKAAQHAGWHLPGVERWGAKSRNNVVCAPGMQHLHDGPPDFATLDFAAARLLRDIVDGDNASSSALYEKEPDTEDTGFGVQLLVNPVNHRPYYVGLVRLDEDRMEPGSGPEVVACAAIAEAIHALGLYVQHVLLERVAGRQAVKQAKSFWIETLVRAGAALVNNERLDVQRNSALLLHQKACAKIVKVVITPIAATDVEACVDDGGELPNRHGERWMPEEASDVEVMYLAGSNVTELAKKYQRKVTAIAAKLASLAKSNAPLSKRLRDDGLIDEMGKPTFLSASP